MEQNLNHNHEADITLARQQISNALKRKANEALCERPTKVIRREIANSRLSDIVTNNDMNRFRKNLSAAKLRKFPKLSTTILELHECVHTYSLKTSSDENFVFYNDEVSNVIIFTCQHNLDTLENVTTIFIDGTFKSTPKLFCQIFTVFLSVGNFYVPVVFSILPNKTTEAYKIVMDQIAPYMLNVTTVFADFEQSIHSAVSLSWPWTKIRGCSFHLTQSWWRKIQALGLSLDFKDQKSEVGNILKMFFGLPLLPPDQVVDCCVEDLYALKPENNEKLTEFDD